MLDEMKNDVIVMGDGSRIRGCFSFVSSLAELRATTRLHQQTMLVKRLRFCFQTVCAWKQCHFSFCFVFCPDRGKRCTGGAVAGSRNSISGQGFLFPERNQKNASYGLHLLAFSGPPIRLPPAWVCPALCPWGFFQKPSVLALKFILPKFFSNFTNQQR